MHAEETGKRIQQLRRSQGMTQKDLAQMLHVTDKAVSKWERGLNYPDMAILEPLAVVLNTTVVYLLDIENVQDETKVSAVTAVAVEETERLRQEIAGRAMVILVNGMILYCSQQVLFKILIDRGVIDLIPRFLTIGMGSFTAVLIGNALAIWWKHRRKR